MAFTLRSPDFVHEGAIPARHTCVDSDVAPALEWEGAPAEAKSFVLIVHDPDAPDPKAPLRDWVHWLVYDIPAGTRALPRGGEPPKGARLGITDFGRPGYGGPCPPIGRHRYFFELHALDAPLGDLETPTRAALEKAMKGHVLATAVLMGTFQKPKKER